MKNLTVTIDGINYYPKSYTLRRMTVIMEMQDNSTMTVHAQKDIHITYDDI